jgi:methionine-rich copper-binding protein CopC
MNRTLQHLRSNTVLTLGNRSGKTSARSFTEALEPRLFLSGNVLTSLVGGRLTIQGDNAANAIVLDQNGLGAGQMRIAGSGGTAINDQAGAIIVSGITRGVALKLGDGQDSVTMSGISLPGDLSIGGGGADTLALSEMDIAGTLDIQNHSALGITGSIAGATIGKGLVIQGGAGGNTIAMQSVVVQRGTTITGGRGIDHLTVDGSTFHGAVLVCTGRSADVVQIDAHGATPASPTLFDRPVSVFLGAGNDTLQLGVNSQAGDRSIFAGNGHFHGGAGYNTLADFAASAYTGKSRYQINNFELRTPVPDTTDPTVSATTPAIDATGVALNQGIAANFSEAMNPLTITSANVTVTAPGGLTVLGTVAYSGNTMTFTPTIPLAADTTFTGTITTGASDLAGNPLAHDYVWSFTTGAAPDTTDPTVSSTNPADNATGVALNQSIAAIFSEAMNPLTITSADVTVSAPGGIAVLGTVGYVGSTMTFTPASALAANTIFTATITTGATDLAGNPLAQNYVWSFTTGATPDTTDPTVISTNPANDATGVALNQSVAATFSEAMNPLTITSANVTVTAPGGIAVPGTVNYAGTTLTFTPTNPLAASTAFTGTITTGATDLAGNPLANNYVWTFTTGAAPDTTPPTVVSTNPADLKTNVFINEAIAATFSEPIDPTTITAATFTVTSPGDVAVAGAVNYDTQSDIATFTPSSNLAPNTTFTATITGGVNGVKDLAGNALASDQVWTFTTGTQIAQAPINLGSAAAFAVMATTGITSTDPTTITGDVGVNPGSAQGIPPADVNGSIHVDDQAVIQAQADLLSAYNDAVSRSTTSVALPGDMGGLTFTPGLYTNSSSVLISGSGPGNNVTLDAQGNPNAIFIFKIGSTLTTGTGAQVILAGGAKASNVFWEVGTSATLNTSTIFKGNLLANVSITVNNGSTVEGRLLAGSDSDGAVTIDQSVVSVPTT